MLDVFEIHQPKTVGEASAMLTMLDGEGAIYAGGTELLVVMKERLARFRHLIDIKRIPGLDGITHNPAEGSIEIGPLATHWQIERDPLIRRHAPALAGLAANVGNVRVRRAGTIGGNLCFAEPHSDPATLLTAWRARLTLEDAGTSRTLDVADFFTGLLETDRRPNEILTRISIPLRADAVSVYERCAFHERPSATVAAVVEPEDGQVRESRIVAGSVGPRPQPLPTAEAAIAGRRLDERAIAAAREAAMAEVDVVELGMESADYARHLIGVLVARSLRRVGERMAA